MILMNGNTIITPSLFLPQNKFGIIVFQYSSVIYIVTTVTGTFLLVKIVCSRNLFLQFCINNSQ